MQQRDVRSERRTRRERRGERGERETHLGPLVALPDLAVLPQHLAELALGSLGRLALALAEVAQELLELLLAVALGLAKVAVPGVLLVGALEVAEVGAGRGDGGRKEGAEADERLREMGVSCRRRQAESLE